MQLSAVGHTNRHCHCCVCNGEPLTLLWVLSSEVLEYKIRPDINNQPNGPEHSAKHSLGRHNLCMSAVHNLHALRHQETSMGQT